MSSGFDMFKLFFTLPNAELSVFLWSTGLVILYGVIWLAPFLPPMLKNKWLWIIFLGGIFAGTLAVSFIQIPLQMAINQPLNNQLSKTLSQITTICITGIAIALVTALVQEGTKLVPVALYWWRKKRKITPVSGLILGAIAGAGFGMIEAFLSQNQLLEIGLNNLMKSGALLTVSIFVLRFFSVAFHIGTTAIAGYGLAKGKGWQFYLIIAVVHFVHDYITVLLLADIIIFTVAEILLYIISILVIAYAIWLRWKKTAVKTQGNPDTLS